jgi:DNA-binding NtrC family response regulator
MRTNCGALIGRSKTFLDVVLKIPRLAGCQATVLIEGETGTGKDLYARAIHYQSARKGRPFVPVNCAALPDHLVESELFGHTRGAFTDAARDRKGLLEEAEGGTLFLDEVNSLSLSAQGKLLRFLQDREYRPVGCNKHRTGDVRILAATNRDLRSLVQELRFREDLYHRLNILSVYLPPLRERSEDILLLAHHYLTTFGAEHGRQDLALSETARQRLLAYDWPGNVRELQSVIQRSVILSTAVQLECEDIDLPQVDQTTTSHQPVIGRAAGASEEGLRFGDAKLKAMQEFERGYLVNLLAQYAGNLTQAAKAAGTGRRSLQRLLQRHHLDRRAFAKSA